MKSISIPTITSSQFRCPETKNELISIQTLKTTYFQPPYTQNQVNSDPYTEAGDNRDGILPPKSSNFKDTRQ